MDNVNPELTSELLWTICARPANVAGSSTLQVSQAWKTDVVLLPAWYPGISSTWHQRNSWWKINDVFDDASKLLVSRSELSRSESHTVAW